MNNNYPIIEYFEQKIQYMNTILVYIYILIKMYLFLLFYN